jgi:hypothetical protein
LQNLGQPLPDVRLKLEALSFLKTMLLSVSTHPNRPSNPDVFQEQLNAALSPALKMAHTALQPWWSSSESSSNPTVCEFRDLWIALGPLLPSVSAVEQLENELETMHS